MTALKYQSHPFEVGIQQLWGSSMNHRRGLFFGPFVYLTEYLFPSVIGRKDTLSGNTPYHKPSKNQSHADISALHRDSVTEQNFTNNISAHDVKGAALSQGLTDYLLGKSPLRLISSTEIVEFVPYDHVPEYKLRYRKEKLECGHIITSYLDFEAKRRRCHEYKRIQALNLPPKKSPASVGRQTPNTKESA